MTTLKRWTDVDEYFASLLLPRDAALEGALEAIAKAGLPEHSVAPNQGKLLQLLASVHGARTILEIGTLGAYSTIWLARALPPDGRLVTLERDPRHAEVARANITRAGLDGLVELRVGPALETLPRLEKEGYGPFDLFFIDADKPNNPYYLEWVLRLCRPGSLVIADNVVRSGTVTDTASADQNVQGVRRFTELLGREPRLSGTVVQTVGAKGHDGFALAVVSAP